MIDIFLNWWKYKNIIEPIGWMRWRIRQFSYLRNYTSEKIQISNFMMEKILNTPFDFRDSYFFRYTIQEPIFEKYFQNVPSIQKKYSFQHDFAILDAKIPLRMKKIKKILLVEYGNEQYLVGKIQKKRIENEDLDDIESHIAFLDQKTNLAFFYHTFLLVPDRDYFDFVFREYFENLFFDTFISKIMKKEEIQEKMEKTMKYEFRPKFKKIEIQRIDWNNLYFTREFFFSPEKRKQYPFFLIVGTSGSGKTTYLLHFLVNMIFSNISKNIVFFDTQKTFQTDLRKYLKDEYKQKLDLYIRNSYLIDENSFYLSSQQIYEILNVILENQNILEEREKNEMLGLVENMDFEEIKRTIEEKLEELKQKRLTSRFLERKNILENVYSILFAVKETDINPFEEVLQKKFILVQFQNEIFYFVYFYFFLEEMKKRLREKTGKEFWLFFDETEKYISFEYIRESLMRLLREKRQYGLRVVATANTVDTENLQKLRQMFSVLVYRSPDGYLKQTEGWKNIDFEKETALLTAGKLEKVERNLLLFNFE